MRGVRPHLPRRIATIAAVVLGVLSAALFCPNPWRAREETMSHLCITRQRQLAIAMLGYAADHSGRLPLAGTWSGDIAGHLSVSPLSLSCPVRKVGDSRTYDMPTAMSGRDVEALNPIYHLLLYEARNDVPSTPHRTYPRNLWSYRNWSSPLERYSRRPNRYMWVSYADAHNAAKASFSQDVLSTAYDPMPF